MMGALRVDIVPDIPHTSARLRTLLKLDSLPLELLAEVLKMLTWKDVLHLRAVSCSSLE